MPAATATTAPPPPPPASARPAAAPPAAAGSHQHAHNGNGAGGPGSTMKVPLNLSAVKAALHAKPKTAEQVSTQASTEEETAPAVSQNFSFSQLQQHWQGFFAELKASNGSPIELMLAGSGLELMDRHEVHVLLNSSLQEEPFERLKPRLQYYLRQQLQNGGLSLHARLAEETGPRRLYTNSEKFQHLLQRYPLLGELKDRLGLEADF